MYRNQVRIELCLVKFIMYCFFKKNFTVVKSLCVTHWVNAFVIEYTAIQHLPDCSRVTQICTRWKLLVAMYGRAVQGAATWRI